MKSSDHVSQVWITFKSYLAVGNYKKALELVDTHDEELLKYKDYLSFKAKCLLNLGYIDDAADFYAANNNIQGLVEARIEGKKIEKCEAYQEEKKYDLAINTAKTITNWRDNKAALILLATTHLALRESKDAAPYFEKLLYDFSEDCDSHYWHCFFQIETGRSDAYSNLLKAMERFPGEEKFNLLQIDFFIKKNQLETAILMAEETRKKYPTSSENDLKLIRLLLLTKKTDRAIQCINDSRKFFSKDDFFQRKLKDLIEEFPSQIQKETRVVYISLAKSPHLWNEMRNTKKTIEGYHLKSDDLRTSPSHKKSGDLEAIDLPGVRNKR